MPFPRSLQWRMAAGYTALACLSIAAAAVALVAFPPGEGLLKALAALAVCAAVSAAVAVGLARTLSRSVARSADSLAEGVRRLADGDLEHRVRSSGDVTREAAEAFNLMAETIRDIVRDLDGERALLSAVMETMADGVVVLDSGNRVRLINRTALWLLDAGADAAPGRTLAEVVRDHEVLGLVSESAYSGSIRQAEIELLHQRRFLNVTATPIPDELLGQGMLLTLQDVTHLRQAQTTMREFVSNVSHELRSPLASVKAMVETLDGGAIEDGAAARDFLARMQDDVDRMTAMVEELLELSRLEGGQMPIHLAPIEVGAAVTAVAERFEMQAGARGVGLSADVPPDLPPVMADGGKLDQILTNLLGNALKFTSEGGRVTLSARKTERGVEVSVEDTGIGIPREHLPHIFERFYKVERSRRDGGSGLGLAIARRLAQAHGGDISAASVEGEGSVFTLTLDSRG